MEVSEISLANLVPGQKAGRDSGRALLVAAIAAALAPDFADDDSIRFQLAKVWDFEVTPAARAYVINAVSERVLNALIAGIVGALEGGSVVSINGFATFEKNEIDKLWPMGVERITAAAHAILPTDPKAVETRRAEIAPGSWNGEQLAGGYLVKGATFAAGTTHFYDPATAQYVPIEGVIVPVSGADYGFFSSARITASASDGKPDRFYHVGSLSIGFYARRELRQLPNSDLQLWYIPVSDQAAHFAAARASLAPEYIEANLGTFISAGVHEWARVNTRVLDDVSPGDLVYERFNGVTANKILPMYPRKVSIVRVPYKRIFEVKRVEPEQFRAYFGYQESYLRSVGAWPERVRNKLNGVKCSFRQDFIDAVQ